MRPTILLVDDEPQVLKALQRTLRDDFELFCFSSPKEALAFYELHPTHIVISDMKMPQMSGEEFLAACYQINSESKFCILTGFSDSQATEEVINKVGVAAYFSKPWNNDELKEKLWQVSKDLVQKQKQNRHIKHLSSQKHLANINRDAVIQVIDGLLVEQGQIHQELERYKRSIYQLISLISSMSGCYSQDLSGHEIRVANQAKLLAKKLNFPPEQVRQIYLAALLYRIGQHRANDERDDNQSNELNSDKALGRNSAELMSMVDLLVPSAKIVKAIFEQLDGKGYPDQLAEEEIPLGSKIIRLLVLFDQLVQGSANHQQKSPEGAFVWLEQHGSHLVDGQLLHHFIEMFNDEQNFVFERVKSINQLKVGMINAQDIYKNRGVKILSQGKVFTEGIIDKLALVQENIEQQLTIYVSGYHQEVE